EVRAIRLRADAPSLARAPAVSRYRYPSRCAPAAHRARNRRRTAPATRLRSAPPPPPASRARSSRAGARSSRRVPPRAPPSVFAGPLEAAGDHLAVDQLRRLVDCAFLPVGEEGQREDRDYHQ